MFRPAIACSRVLPTCLLAALAFAAGCASGPSAEPTVERVDERTAVTVVTLPKPLLYSGARGGLGQPLDLALGPVEINRMGEKSWYLWVSLLGADLRDGEPRLRLASGGERLADLAPLPSEFTLPTSRAPYAQPADWASERYYAISASELADLYGRAGLTVEVSTPAGETWTFDPWDASAANLDAWLQRQLQTQVAAR
jgi:hypothetical protein